MNATIATSPIGMKHGEFIHWLESDRAPAIIAPEYTRWYLNIDHAPAIGSHAPVIVCSRRIQSDNPGLGRQNYGVFVRVYQDYRCIAKTFVPAATRYEPHTRNNIGELGAYRDIPNDSAIDQAIADMTAQIAQ